jgi:hypothetical protein
VAAATAWRDVLFKQQHFLHARLKPRGRNDIRKASNNRSYRLNAASVNARARARRVVMVD